MTDKQKGLIPAVEETFPESEHRFCVRHLYANFKDAGFKGEILKNQLWTCARASTVQKWEHHMEKMKGLSLHAYKWLDRMAPNTWVRAYFSEFPKIDLLLNNSCEVFNSYILEARELPILSMLEKIKQQLMTRFYNKQMEMVDKFVGPICPKIRKKVSKNAELANLCYAMSSGQGIFQVIERDFQYIVNIGTKVCECRKWNLTGIPCQHAISCLRHERIPVESVVHECYSLEAFNRAYGSNIIPCRDGTLWEKVNGPTVLPPKYEKKVGRPPRCRRKEPQEVQGKNGPSISKHGVVIKCSYCKGENHNVRGCFLKKAGINPEDYVTDDPLQAEGNQNQPNLDVADTSMEEQIPISQMVSQDAPQPSQVFTETAATTYEHLTQAGDHSYSNLLSNLSSTMLLQMMEEGSQAIPSSHGGPSQIHSLSAPTGQWQDHCL